MKLIEDYKKGITDRFYYVSPLVTTTTSITRHDHHFHHSSRPPLPSLVTTTITALWGVSFAAVAITITNTINDAATIVSEANGTPCGVVIRSIGRVLQHAVGDEPQPPT